MAVVLDDLPELQRRVDRLRQARDQATGAINQIFKRIREEHGCRDASSAKAKLLELEELERLHYGRYLKARKEFELKWARVLSEQENGG